jgi:hypothetical protein
MKTDVIKKRQRTETLLASSSLSTSEIDINNNDQSKKPRYYDQRSLTEKGTTLGYRNAAASLPGTGILMMTTSNSTPSPTS